MRHKTFLFLAAPALMLSSLGASAQDRGNFYNGVRDGGRDAHYDRYDHRQYNDDDRYRNNDGRGYQQGYQQPYHQGGIGPGKGALIGGAGGAALGAIFGGGLKGTLIGGAAGAGIGAIVGKEHQNNVRRNEGYYGR